MAVSILRAEVLQDVDESFVIDRSIARNEHAKAGNLNAGLQLGRGELVAVFDADFVPQRHFLGVELNLRYLKMELLVILIFAFYLRLSSL